MHDFQEQCQVHGQHCEVRGQRSKNGFSIRFIDPARNWEITWRQSIIKQLLDSVFVISGKIKVSVSVISLRLRLRLITLTSKSCQDCLSFRIKPTLCGLTVRRPRSIAAPSLLNLSTGEKRRGRDRPRTSENQANTVGRVNKKCIHF